MLPQGSKIQSIISVAGHQVIRNLSETALLTTGGPRIKKLHGRYVEVYEPYQVIMNVDGISIYSRIYVTTDSDQIVQIYLGEEELKLRRKGHDAMMEQDAVHIG